MSRTLDDLAWPRRTERLVLRRATPEDADAMWPVKSDPALNQWTSKCFVSREDFDQEWPRRMATGVMADWDGRFAAHLSIRRCDAWAHPEVAHLAAGSQAELGWTVLPWAQGQGIATELAREGLAIVFDMGVRRVEAFCFEANVASWKVMERIGMRREVHSVKESLHRDGQWYDGLGYAMLADEFIR